MSSLTEDAIEKMVLDELQALGWQTAFGPDLAPGRTFAGTRALQ